MSVNAGSRNLYMDHPLNQEIKPISRKEDRGKSVFKELKERFPLEDVKEVKKQKLDPDEFIKENFKSVGTIIVNENSQRIEVNIYKPVGTKAFNLGYRYDILYALMPPRQGSVDKEIIDLSSIYSVRPFNLRVEMAQEAELQRNEYQNYPPRPGGIEIYQKTCIRGYHNGFLMYTRKVNKSFLRDVTEHLQAFPIRIASQDDLDLMKHRRVVYCNQLGRVVGYNPLTGEVQIESTKKSGKGFALDANAFYREEKANECRETGDFVEKKNKVISIDLLSSALYWGNPYEYKDWEKWSDEKGNPLNRDGSPWVFIPQETDVETAPAPMPTTSSNRVAVTPGVAYVSPDWIEVTINTSSDYSSFGGARSAVEEISTEDRGHIKELLNIKKPVSKAKFNGPAKTHK